MNKSASITCPKCKRVSFNKGDVDQRFCVVCGYHAHLKESSTSPRNSMEQMNGIIKGVDDSLAFTTSFSRR